MTNVDSPVRPCNNVDRKLMFGYLTAKLPGAYGYAKKVANALNNSGKRSTKGDTYTKNIVYQVVDKGYADINVERALVALNVEYYGLPIGEICPDYVPSL